MMKVAAVSVINEDSDGKIKETLASSIYDTLRQDILTLALPADGKLNIRSLSSRFGVGLSPVREALSRLSMENLVTQIDHRGFKVASLSIADLHDLFHARISVDSMALRQSIEAHDIAWEEQLLLAYHRLSRTPRAASEDNRVRSPEWEEVHRRFHVALVAGCGSRWLVNISGQLFEAGERYRHVARLAGKSRIKEDEHKAITDAALARDAELATKLLASHYQKTAELAELSLSGKS
ncbi:FCD domain-containing protein [Agrobacterium rhizogenes]|uniref:GntR family transcriptional regulator n=1 Tax=Rhizobium rhizogenes TaxID=359 RepID=UPI0009DF0C35|nr:FCD domain-containing protein [Rhizobium rhizogenes]KAA6475598.1 FCD domain-containing protein [Agrobacterium sp. ICMP 7243]MDJ1635232.1 FCD domain-containing protein [Rhizobium rhizogenes]NTG10661.1 FCD domain-containing protein [Rhizobium rhizogenes]NTG17132.1 FCD domain-containing protein [Rhizobium rhizogenes]NTG30743.1 FCD domain-containing protein [Rhizobium rhizogenes]